MRLPRTKLIGKHELDQYAGQLWEAHGWTLSKSQAYTAIKRWSILRRWELAKLGAPELGIGVHEATRRFIAAMADRFGEVVSVRTLCGWDRRYRAGGLGALIDHRTERMKAVSEG